MVESKQINSYTSKSGYMVFYRGWRESIGNIALYIDTCTIEINEAEIIKYLRIMIDAKLNLFNHITYVNTKISKGIWITK